MKRKWDYQETYSDWQVLLDEIDCWFWKHMHWLWWGKESLFQRLRDWEDK